MESTNVPGHIDISKHEKDTTLRSTSLPEDKTNTLVQTATAEPDNEHPSIKATTTREDGTEYPKGPKLALIALALCLSVFLVALGISCLFFQSSISGLIGNFANLMIFSWF